MVESKATTEGADPIMHALRHRVRQQEILAELGVGALQGPGFDHLLSDTARLTAEGLRAEFCKVLEHIPAENRLLVRAGVWLGPGRGRRRKRRRRSRLTRRIRTENWQASDLQSSWNTKSGSERQSF